MKPEKGKKKEKVSQPVKKETTSGGLSFLSSILFNVIGGVVALVFLYVIFSNIQGYDWMLNTMLKNNFETIEKYPDLNIGQRYELKWGGEIGYVNRIKQSTPDSAIIIVPPRKILTQAGFKSTVELPWLSYFVYPRRVVYEDDKDSSAIYKQATYILAVNGWGFDKVNYHIDKPEAFMILPLKK
jgi:hypothetical protein